MEAEIREGNNPALTAELGQMFAVDQEIRNRRHKAAPEDEADWADQVRRIDNANTQRLKEIIAEYGWPTLSLAGTYGEEAAWVIAQHADRDVAFQRECLLLLEAAVQKGDAKPDHLAYLTDRVLTNEGRPQIYGTQHFVDGEGRYGPRPIKDGANVDARRQQMGMNSLKEYQEWMASLP